jgi:hypothetical protein
MIKPKVEQNAPVNKRNGDIVSTDFGSRIADQPGVLPPNAATSQIMIDFDWRTQ